MPNITLSVEEGVLKKARKVAVEKNTNLTTLIRSFLETLGSREESRKEEVLRKLQKSFDRVNQNALKNTNKNSDEEPRGWTREDAHER